MDAPANPNPPPTPAAVPTPEAIAPPDPNLAAAVLPPPALLSWKWRYCKFSLWCLGALVVMYLVSAYIIVPAAWRHFTSRHPALDGMPKFTKTGNGIPGDPLNVALIGTKEDITTILVKAGWQPADDITMKSTLRIASSTLFKKPYDKAPVSNLFLWGRKQDLAFQQPMKNPRQRHHVRFWQSEDVDDEGRPLWIGAATFDTKVGFSHTTGQITHHIAPDIDTERDKLFKDLEATGFLVGVTWVEDFHEHGQGHNGGGDPYHTDGHLVVGTIRRPGE
jgi:hypothetical protein